MSDKKNYNYLFKTILTMAALLVFITSCEDNLLEQKPRGEQTLVTFFESEEDAILATNATYEELRDFGVHVFGWLGMTDIASDDAVKGSSTSDSPDMQQIDTFTFTSSNGLFTGPWRAYYRGIFRANQAIANIPDIDMDENLKQRLIGENKFLRAYYYFFLVRAYGGVPRIIEPLAPSEFEQPRASAEDIYELIEQDLEDAIEALPLKSEYAISDLGRATKGAAQAYLAKVHLFQGEHTEAEQFAREVINSGEYSLFPDYDRIFTPDGENSSESVFEVQTVAVEAELGGSQYSQVQGVRGLPNLGWGFNGPSRDLLSSYESGDPRLQPTILFVYEGLPRGPEDVVRDNPSMIDERYNQKSFIPLQNPGGSDNGGSNIRRMRYSDVLLIAAEAAYQNGNEVDARNFANQVRARARDGRTATIGLQVEALTQLVADTLGQGSITPVPFIRYVTEGSTADNTGLQSFDFELANDNQVILINNIDIIQQVDGQSVATVEDYYDIMATKTPGVPVQLDILRASQTLSGDDTQTNTQSLSFTVVSEALLPDITATGQDLLNAIWKERRSELAMEQHRFFDLRRQGRAAEVLQALGINYESPKHDLFPIPQEEVQLGGYEQNPGYN